MRRNTLRQMGTLDKNCVVSGRRGFRKNALSKIMKIIKRIKLQAFYFDAFFTPLSSDDH